MTLVLRGVMRQLEVQLLRYRHPEPLKEPEGMTVELSDWGEPARLPDLESGSRSGSG